MSWPGAGRWRRSCGRSAPLRGYLTVNLDQSRRAGQTLEGSDLPIDARRIYARNLEVPSGGGVGTARAIARAYGAFTDGGRELGLSPETLRLLSAPAIPPTLGFQDVCLKGEVRFALAFMKPSPVWQFGSEAAFGSPGFGGASGYADPAASIGYGYVTNRMGTALTGDPRDVALRDAIESVL